ncbi:MAG: hypothetical protein R3C58_14050 [Parvularculaceae bacterium]
MREWLSVNAAAGYINYDAKDETFMLTPEQATIFAREGQPCVQGFFQAIISQFEAHEKIINTFKSGKGRPWSDQPACCFCATDRFFVRVTRRTSSTAGYRPCRGSRRNSRSGGSVADIGCGSSSTILMGKSFEIEIHRLRLP